MYTFHPLQYAFSAAWSYFLSAVWLAVRPLLARYYRTGLQRQLFAGVARIHFGLPSIAGVVAVAIGAPILLGMTWPRMPPWFSFFALSAIVYMALLHSLSRPTGLFHLHSLGRGRIAVHMRAAKAKDGDLRAQLAQLEDVMKLARQSRAKTLELDSPLLVSQITKELLAARFVELASTYGLTASVVEQAPRALPAIVSGFFAPYRGAYQKLRGGRVEWSSPYQVKSRKLVITLA